MADELTPNALTPEELKATIAKEAAMLAEKEKAFEGVNTEVNSELKRGEDFQKVTALNQKEFKLAEGLLTDIELEKFEKGFFKRREEELKKELEKAEKTVFESALVNETNVSSFFYVTSDFGLEDAEAKANEITAFLKALLKPGIYSSVEEAFKKGIPAGTLILVDDPKTDERDFAVKVVTEVYSVKKEEKAAEVAVDSDQA